MHLALVGPTASGKSALAMAYAGTHADIEIVSMDSMQVYRGMDIGTAKAMPAEQRAVPHHMIDVAEPHEDFSVARFQAEARAVIASIEARGHRALLVGGTGLYLQAVIDDLRFPGEDLARRARIDEGCDSEPGLADAYARLTELDPVAASRMEPGNRRRIVRALEVIELTGRPFSSFGAGIGADHTPMFSVRIAGLALDAKPLAARLDVRMRTMIDAGWIDEVRGTGGASRGLVADGAPGHRLQGAGGVRRRPGDVAGIGHGGHLDPQPSVRPATAGVVPPE